MSPTFTYTTPTSNTHGIGTDVQGNVYVATDGGQIVEFPHRSDTPIATCSIGGSAANGAEGLAIDAAGDVFVSIAGSSSAGGSIFEYAGGLTGCSPVRLPVYMGGGGGLAVDSKQRLVAIDQQGAIDIIPPPYQKATRRRRFRHPFQVTLNAAETLLFVTERYHTPAVLNYPSLSFIRKLGPKYGLRRAFGVAAFGGPSPASAEGPGT
jgi:hypothetical protein